MEKKWVVTFTVYEDGVLIEQEELGVSILEKLGCVEIHKMDIINKEQHHVGP